MRATLIAVGLALLGAIPLPITPLRAAPSSSPDTPVSAEKLDDYIKGYNALLSTFGLEAQYHQYLGQAIARKAVGDAVFLTSGWLSNGDDDLKAGQAIPGGGLPEVDAAADAMIPILDRLIERLSGLEAYYASRGQLEDKFARGKREDPLVLADFRAALAAMQPLSDALDTAINRRDTANLLLLQQQGDQVGFNGGLALQEARQLMALFRDPQGLRNPAVIAKADTLADAMLQALADENAALATAKAAGNDDHALRNSNYSMAAERLQGMVGAYRDMKHTGNPGGAALMLGSYNAAVEMVNVGQ